MKRLLFFCLFCLLVSPARAGLRVGLVLPLSGVESREGLVLQRWSTMLAHYLWSSPGEVELVPLDSQGRPSHIPAVVREAASQGIEVLIGPARPECAAPLVQEAKKFGLTVILTSGEINPVKEIHQPFGKVFRVGLSTRAAVKVLYHCLNRKGYRQIGLLISDDFWGREGEKWLQAYAAEYALKIKKIRRFGPNDTDVTFHLEALRDTEAVVCWAGPWASLTVARNINQMGLRLPVCFSHHLSPEGFLQTYPALQGKPFVGAAFLAPERLFPGDKIAYDLLEEFIRQQNITYDIALAAWADAFIFLKRGLETGEGQGLVKELEKVGLLKGVTGYYFLSADDHYGLLPATVGVYKYRALTYEPVCPPRKGIL